MNKLIAIILLFSSSVSADTNWYRVAANTALVADWFQTHEIAGNDDFYETNHLLGEHPSTSEVNRYFATSILLTNVIGELLPKTYSNYFYVTVTVVETAVVLDNYRVGIRVKI